MSKIKKTKTFICPFCKKESDYLTYTQDISTLSSYDIESGEYNFKEELGGENGQYYCPDCDEEISYEELKKQNIEG